MRSENLAIAFVDIRGFTERTSTQSRAENERLLRRFDASVRPVVRAFRGRVVKAIGDAFLLAFRSPTDALHCAMAVHDRLAESNARAPEAERFDVRVAVNVGEVRLDGGDVFGEAVNIASRIESLAGGGEIWFSEAVYLVMNKSEVPCEEVGPRQLKGVPEPVRVYRVPRASEVGGYRLAGRGTGGGATPVHRLEPPELPYGGAALSRVRARLPAPGADGSFPGAGGGWRSVFEGARERFRSDASFRIAVLAVAGLLAALLVWGLWPRRRLSRWDRLKRDLLSLGVPESPRVAAQDAPNWTLTSQG